MIREAQLVKPLTWPMALLYFGLSALVFRIVIYGLMPFLLDNGLLQFWAFMVCYSLALAVLMIATLVALTREGYPLNSSTFEHRLRFKKLKGSGWAWSISLFLIGFLLTGALIPTAQAIAKIPTFAPPSFSS